MRQRLALCLSQHLKRAIVLLCLCLIPFSYAANVETLYESSVKVEEGVSENELILSAFTNVLVKVSGRSDINTHPSYQAMLDKAKQAVSQFRYDYREIPVQEELETTQETIKKTIETDNRLKNSVQSKDSKTEDQEPEREKWFWVRFNAQIVEQLLTEAQLPVWGKMRPATLIWFSEEAQGQRYLQSQYDAPEVYEALSKQAEQRGISLNFPFLDLQDQASLSANDIWGGFTDAILTASRRYQAQVVLTLSLFKEPTGLWVSQWQLLMLGDVHGWEIRDEDKDRILQTGIDELADKLAFQFTQMLSGEQKEGLIIQVNNVSDFKSFQALDDYLNNLATIKSALLIKTTRDRVWYQVSYLGDQTALMQEIRLGDMLHSVERSQSNVDEQGNEIKEYQPVILDNVPDEQRAMQPLSAREQALQALEQNNLQANQQRPFQQQQSQATAYGTQQYNSQHTVNGVQQPQAMLQEPILVPKPRPLIPDLEYWLAR